MGIINGASNAESINSGRGIINSAVMSPPPDLDAVSAQIEAAMQRAIAQLRADPTINPGDGINSDSTGSTPEWTPEQARRLLSVLYGISGPNALGDSFVSAMQPQDSAQHSFMVSEIHSQNEQTNNNSLNSLGSIDTGSRMGLQPGGSSSDAVIASLGATNGGNGPGPVSLGDGRYLYPDGRIGKPSVSVGPLVASGPPDSGSASAYPDSYAYVGGQSGSMPVGGFENLRLARDVATMPSNLTPTLLDGRTGAGIPYVDQAGQVFYQTFDAGGNKVAWRTVAAPGAASSIPFMARVAAAGEGFLATEAAVAPMPLKLAALGTLAAANYLVATRFVGDPPDYGGGIHDNPMPPRLDIGPLITPADTRQSPVVTIYPAERPAQPIVNGLPMAQPENYGPVGGGFASGGMPGQSNVMLKSPSEILGENLEAAGQTRPADSAAHHIVPYGDWRAQNIRDLFNNLGIIDLNSADNGVFLPQTPDSTAPGAYHPSLNSQEYHDQLQRDFANVNSKNDALDVLDRIRIQLRNGTYPGSKPVRTKNP